MKISKIGKLFDRQRFRRHWAKKFGKLWSTNFRELVSYAGSLGLSSGISLQFTLEMCAAAKNCKKFTKTLFWGFKVGGLA